MSTYPKNTKNGIVYDYYLSTWYIEIVKNNKFFYQICIYNKQKDCILISNTKMYL